MTERERARQSRTRNREKDPRRWNGSFETTGEEGSRQGRLASAHTDSTGTYPQAATANAGVGAEIVMQSMNEERPAPDAKWSLETKAIWGAMATGVGIAVVLAGFAINELTELSAETEELRADMREDRAAAEQRAAEDRAAGQAEAQVRAEEFRTEILRLTEEGAATAATVAALARKLEAEE